jgi:predicted transposase/invertase (TIGR01784 family)
MKHRIDPKVDCVFKALLGSEENRNLLIHFLNAILGADLAAPIAEAEILNPYNDKEFLDDKLSIVDVKARDRAGRLYQVEIQLLNYRHLPARMAYTWADLYSQQLQSGQSYSQLKPTYGIWLLGENLIPGNARYAHTYKLRDDQGCELVEHGGIWVLELKKFVAERVETEEQRWLKLFKEGERLDDAALPDWMNTTEMRQAMSTLRQFSDKERDYHAYQARQNFLRQQQALQEEREQAEREREQAEREREQAEREREQAEREREQAEREREQAEREREQAEREREQAEREREQAQQALERERLEKAAALAEIERLKALLGQR